MRLMLAYSIAFLQFLCCFCSQMVLFSPGIFTSAILLAAGHAICVRSPCSTLPSLAMSSVCHCPRDFRTSVSFTSSSTGQEPMWISSNLTLHLTNCETIARKLHSRNLETTYKTSTSARKWQQKTAKQLPPKKISKQLQWNLGSQHYVFYLMGSTIKADNGRHQQAVEWSVLMFLTL